MEHVRDTNIRRCYDKMQELGGLVSSEHDELRERIVAVWEAVDQRVIDAAIRQWRERLLACVKAKGEYFEHLLK